MKTEVSTAFETGDFAGIVRLMDKHFSMHNYSLKDLFADGQRKILTTVITSTIDELWNGLLQHVMRTAAM